MREAVRIDPTNACLRRGSQAIAFTPKAFSVLCYLSENPARLVTKEELLEALWPGRYITDGVLKACIREIHKALGDEPKRPALLRSCTGAGTA
jgi:DNA-binding winged helix-turn-helix (wHTH) protein